MDMRAKILKVVPHAEEVISYGMPAFKVNGEVIAGIMAAKNHIGYYPFSGTTLNGFKRELSRYSTTKSAIHVPIGKPLSLSLISKLIKARISQCAIVRRERQPSGKSGPDLYWKALGIAAPARRGLLAKKIFNLHALSKITKEEFLSIHGIGPSSSYVIIREMKKEKILFKP